MFLSLLLLFSLLFVIAEHCKILHSVGLKLHRNSYRYRYAFFQREKKLLMTFLQFFVVCYVDVYRGAFGKVYSGNRITDNRSVAIKHIAKKKVRLSLLSFLIFYRNLFYFLLGPGIIIIFLQRCRLRLQLWHLPYRYLGRNFYYFYFLMFKY